MQKTTLIPEHIAIIMDGNGRWARKRFLPRLAGHQAGMKATRKIVAHAAKRGVKVLSLFTFSCENWQRPSDEIENILSLFLQALQFDAKDLHENNVRLKIIGDISAFSPTLQSHIHQAEQLTASNSGMFLVIAVNYSGKWDITQAINTLIHEREIGFSSSVNAETIESKLSLANLPDPDLFIRSGGERRISNFYLWQLAYTELYFTDLYWPDFDEQAFDEALEAFQLRERRFGQIKSIKEGI